LHAAAIGVRLAEDPEVTALLSSLRDGLFPFATAEWLTLAPDLVEVFRDMLEPLHRGVTMREAYAELFPPPSTDPSASPVAAPVVAVPSAAPSVTSLPVPSPVVEVPSVGPSGRVASSTHSQTAAVVETVVEPVVEPAAEPAAEPILPGVRTSEWTTVRMLFVC